MDPVNGRNRELTNSQPLVFTAPYSGDEILLLPRNEKSPLGIVYHPLKMDEPIAWISDCPHCIRGQQVGLDIALKRMVQILCSRQVKDDIESYQIPTNNEPCAAICKRNDKHLIVKLVQPGREPIDAIWNGRQFVTKGSYTLLRSKIIDRSLRLLSSIKTTSKREVLASLMPLLARQRRDGIAIHRRHPCLKIDWATVADELQ
jgi:hypothetical protein